MKTPKRKKGQVPAPADSMADILQVRLQPSEKEAFQDAAEIAGIPLSSWVRERLRRAAMKELEEVGQRARFLADLYPQD